MRQHNSLASPRHSTESDDDAYYTWDLTSRNPLLLSDGTTSYLYDNAGNPIEHIDGSGTALYYQHDQYGSTRILTDATGTTAATFTYMAGGQLTSRTGTADTPLRWNAQYLDAETGNYYLRARYYDPATTQFLTVDPMRAVTGSTYGYADDNSLNSSDPSGLCPQCAVFAIGALIGGGMDLGAQVLGNAARGCPYFSNINWGSVGVSALAGGLSEFGGEALLGARAAGGLRHSAGEGLERGAGSVVREVAPNENFGALCDELCSLTWTTGREHALVNTTSGFEIESGGATGIDLSSDVTQVIAHTHPYHLDKLGPSPDDVAMLSQWGQSSSILLEHRQTILFGPEGSIVWGW